MATLLQAGPVLGAMRNQVRPFPSTSYRTSPADNFPHVHVGCVPPRFVQGHRGDDCRELQTAARRRAFGGGQGVPDGRASRSWERPVAGEEAASICGTGFEETAEGPYMDGPITWKHRHGPQFASQGDLHRARCFEGGPGAFEVWEPMEGPEGRHEEDSRGSLPSASMGPVRLLGPLPLRPEDPGRSG